MGGSIVFKPHDCQPDSDRTLPRGTVWRCEVCQSEWTVVDGLYQRDTFRAEDGAEYYGDGGLGMVQLIEAGPRE